MTGWCNWASRRVTPGDKCDVLYLPTQSDLIGSHSQILKGVLFFCYKYSINIRAESDPRSAHLRLVLIYSQD